MGYYFIIRDKYDLALNENVCTFTLANFVLQSQELKVPPNHPRILLKFWFMIPMLFVFVVVAISMRS